VKNLLDSICNGLNDDLVKMEKKFNYKYKYDYKINSFSPYQPSSSRCSLLFHLYNDLDKTQNILKNNTNFSFESSRSSDVNFKTYDGDSLMALEEINTNLYFEVGLDLFIKNVLKQNSNSKIYRYVFNHSPSHHHNHYPFFYSDFFSLGSYQFSFYYYYYYSYYYEFSTADFPFWYGYDRIAYFGFFLLIFFFLFYFYFRRRAGT
jgi:hypothetical protein